MVKSKCVNRENTNSVFKYKIRDTHFDKKDLFKKCVNGTVIAVLNMAFHVNIC